MMEDKILYAEIILKVRTCNLITEEILEEEHGGDMEAFVRDLVDREGLPSITDLEFTPEIIRVTKKDCSENQNDMLNLNFI